MVDYLAEEEFYKQR